MAITNQVTAEEAVKLLHAEKEKLAKEIRSLKIKRIRDIAKKKSQRNTIKKQATKIRELKAYIKKRDW